MRLHAVGACPQLRALHHCAWGATAAHLRQYMMLQSLSNRVTFGPTHYSLVEGLTPLTRLQHLHLTRRVPLKHFPSGVPRCAAGAAAAILTPQQPALCTCQTAGCAMPAAV